MQTKNINLVVLPGLILLSAAGVYSSLEIAIDTRNSLSPTLAKRGAAVANIPWSAEYQSRLADLRRSSGLPFTNNLRVAVGNSPADSRLWVELGLAQEQDGDMKSAESSLLWAGTLGQDYDTRWTLTNFFFRRADRARALAWGCTVLSIPGVEAGPVFSLLSNFPVQPACLLLNSFKGPQSARLGYLQWLISKAKLDEAGPVAGMLVENASPETIRSLLDYDDRLLMAGKAQQATRLWNIMANQRLVSTEVLENGALRDGGLMLDDPPHAFAWRTAPVQGADFVLMHPGLQMSLSGTQPDRCELLSQWAILGPGLRHVLRYRFASSGIAASSGIHWEINTPGEMGLLNPFEHGKDLSAQASADAFIRFKAPTIGKLIRVGLVYQRNRGAAPARGWIRLETAWLSD